MPKKIPTLRRDFLRLRGNLCITKLTIIDLTIIIYVIIMQENEENLKLGELEDQIKELNQALAECIRFIELKRVYYKLNELEKDKQALNN